MIEIKGGQKEQVVRLWLNEKMGAVVPKAKTLDLFNKFIEDCPDELLSYGLFNGVIRKVQEEGHKSSKGLEETQEEEEDSVVPEIINIEDLEFPDVSLLRTGKKIDEILSDHEEGGGLYTGTVNIVIGESGVGKSTVLLDMLTSIKRENPEAKVLYISSEMTRNDIAFYYRKTPAIGRVPTLILMDYIKDGKMSSVLKTTFNQDYDVILLDSYQDVLVKLKEVHNWKSTYAESWLTNMMIDAAEKKGIAVLAIQHMTKGGTYVGSTYLKHATTSMIEIKFDEHGGRYILASKNRRGGSGVNRPLYYSLGPDGEIVYDEDRFLEEMELKGLEANETIRQTDLSRLFDQTFMQRDHSVVDHSHEIELEIETGSSEEIEEEEVDPTLENN
jgi:ABC-type molybdenum transport system ATPase subunit/photorepair protein PhrA